MPPPPLPATLRRRILNPAIYDAPLMTRTQNVPLHPQSHPLVLKVFVRCSNSPTLTAIPPFLQAAKKQPDPGWKKLFPTALLKTSQQRHKRGYLEFGLTSRAQRPAAEAKKWLCRMLEDFWKKQTEECTYNAFLEAKKKKLFSDARSNLLKERFLRRRLLFGRKHEFGQYTNHPATIFSPFPPLFFCLRKPIRCCSIATETIWPLNTTNRTPVTLSRLKKNSKTRSFVCRSPLLRLLHVLSSKLGNWNQVLSRGIDGRMD